jgi:hypothetical protein
MAYARMAFFISLYERLHVVTRSRCQIWRTRVIIPSWIEYYINAFCGRCLLASDTSVSHVSFSILRFFEIKVRFV